nr:immunoglobulin heavy chain junction region [Mus musculus]
CAREGAPYWYLDVW